MLGFIRILQMRPTSSLSMGASLMMPDYCRLNATDIIKIIVQMMNRTKSYER